MKSRILVKILRNLCALILSLYCFFVFEASSVNAATLGHLHGSYEPWEDAAVHNYDSGGDIFVMWDFYISFTDPPQGLFGSDYEFEAHLDERNLSISSWEISSGGTIAYSGTVGLITESDYYYDNTGNWIHDVELILNSTNFSDLMLSGVLPAPTAQAISYLVFGFDGDLTGTPVPLPSAIWLLGSGLIGLLGFQRKIKMK